MVWADHQWSRQCEEILSLGALAPWRPSQSMILGSGSRDLQTHQGKSWPGMHRVWTRVDSHLISLFFCLYDDVSLRSQVGQGLGAKRASEDALMLTYFSVSIKGLGRLSLQLLPLRRRLLRLNLGLPKSVKPKKKHTACAHAVWARQHAEIHIYIYIYRASHPKRDVDSYGDDWHPGQPPVAPEAFPGTRFG